MANLPFEVRQDESALRAHIVRCGAFVTVSEDESKMVAWIDMAAREHLENYARDQLSLELNDVQHGIIALRCLEYIRSNVLTQQELYDETEKDPEQEDTPADNEESAPVDKANDGPESNQSEEGEPVDQSDDASSNQPPDNLEESCQPEEEDPTAQKDLFEDDQQVEEQMYSGNVQISEAPSEAPALLRYPYDYWLEHAKLADIDVVDEFNLNDEFWSEDSASRAAWWKGYGEMNGFNGMDHTTSLPIAASIWVYCTSGSSA